MAHQAPDIQLCTSGSRGSKIKTLRISEGTCVGCVLAFLRKDSFYVVRNSSVSLSKKALPD